MNKKAVRTAVVTIALALILLGNYLIEPGSPPAPPRSGRSAAATSETGAHATGPYSVGGVSIIDSRTGKTLRLGEVDLRPTLDRIAAGRRNSHPNDGSVWENRSRRLPERPRGYYREYVVPTPGLSGPGPQRLVIGEKGEVYYTHDHYSTFIRLPEEGTFKENRANRRPISFKVSTPCTVAVTFCEGRRYSMAYP